MRHTLDRNPRLRDRPLRLLLRWLVGLAAVTALAAVFTKLAGDVLVRGGLPWDAPLIEAVHRLSRPWLDSAMRAATETGEVGAAALVLLLAAWFLWRQDRLDAATVVISAVGAMALNGLLKLVLARPRPAFFPPLVVEGGFSFPSGHVTTAVAVYGLLAVLLWRQRRRAWAVASGAWVLVVAFSRVYLGVHYPSDTLGSMAFASLWLLAVVAIRDRYAGGSRPELGAEGWG